MEEVAFRLETYRFTKASLNFNLPDQAELNVAFTPRGVFYPKEARYELMFDATIACKETNTTVFDVSCFASFSFKNVHTLDEIPDFFYPNSIAILFPYVRAFISTMSLQANVQPVILPTINLMGLTEDLKKQTKVSDLNG